MLHTNLRFTGSGRLLVVQWIEGGMPRAQEVLQMGAFRCAVAKWWCRGRKQGKASLVDRIIRTLADEFLYSKRSRSEAEQRIRFRRWNHDYYYRRHQTAAGDSNFIALRKLRYARCFGSNRQDGNFATRKTLGSFMSENPDLFTEVTKGGYVQK